MQGLYVLLSDAGFSFHFKSDTMVIIEKIDVGDQGEDAVVLSPSIALAERPTGVTIDKNNTGRAVIGREAIESLNQGTGDPTDAFSQLPNVAFSDDQYKVNNDSEQSLLPQEVSISGGEVFNNLVTFDGLQTKSYTYSVDNNNPAHYDSLGISTTNLVLLDAGLLEQIAVQDSNISAKYTGFTGGVVEYKTRDPKNAFGATITGSYQSDALTHYIVGVDGEVDESEDPKPEFTKFSIGGTLDFPINEKLSSMVAFSVRQSEIKRIIDDRYSAYRGSAVHTKDQSFQFLGKLKYNISSEDTLLLTSNVTPYKSEFTRPNAYGDEQDTDGVSYINSLEWRHERGSFSSNIKTFYSNTTMKRDAPDNYYLWTNTTYNDPDATPSSLTDVCSSSRCIVGGFGDIRTKQQTFGVSSDFTYALKSADVNFGFRWNRDNVHNQRFDTDYIYSYTRVNQSDSVNIICDSGDACIEGQEAITRRNVLEAYDVKVNMNSLDGYVELEQEKPLDGFISKFRYRVGLAASYEDYLKNFSVAPRLTVGVDFAENFSLDLGANRYYTRNFLGYALRDGKPNTVLENRVYDITGSDYTFYDDWTVYTQSTATKYADSNLKTPYSDELTAAITYSDADSIGTIRIKGIYRKNDDRITRTMEEVEETRINRGNEVTYTQRYYTPSNDGSSTYSGLSLEWNKSLKNHFLSLTATLSKTKTSNVDYYSTLDDTSEIVSYIADPLSAANASDLSDEEFAGTLTTLQDLAIRREDFSIPFSMSGFWKANWFNKKLSTSIDVKYLPKWTDIIDLSSRSLDGTSYDVYSTVERKNTLRFNARISYKLSTKFASPLTLSARINNLFNNSSRTATNSYPYEKGRSIVLSLRADL